MKRIIFILIFVQLVFSGCATLEKPKDEQISSVQTEKKIEVIREAFTLSDKDGNPTLSFLIFYGAQDKEVKAFFILDKNGKELFKKLNLK